MSTPDFPGIFTRDNGFWALRPTTELHPVRQRLGLKAENSL
jgi:hypothetical protein